MIPVIPVRNTRGFTLIETVIYVGLFGLMYAGIFVSIYPFFTGAERLSRNIATEGETAFILSKIRYALAQGVTTPVDSISEPNEGDTGNVLIVKNGSDETFRFENDTSSTFCTPPRVCGVLVYSKSGEDVLPLNNERVFIEDFNVKHVAPTADAPRYLDISFTANDTHVGPVRYYLHY